MLSVGQVNKLVSGSDANTRAAISSSKDPNMMTTLRTIDKLLSTRATTFDECVVTARRKFDKWCLPLALIINGDLTLTLIINGDRRSGW